MDYREPLKNLWYKINDWYAWLVKKKPVSDNDFLYRRINSEWRHKDGTISTAAFEHLHMSVDLASLTTPQKSWKRAPNPDFGLAQLSVRTMRALKIPQEIKHWPEILNYSHTLVSGEKKKGKMMRKIAESATMIIETAAYRSGAPNFRSIAARNR